MKKTTVIREGRKENSLKCLYHPDDYFKVDLLAAMIHGYEPTTSRNVPKGKIYLMNLKSVYIKPNFTLEYVMFEDGTKLVFLKEWGTLISKRNTSAKFISIE